MKMKMIGLLFSEMMMEANLAHRKTMTRRTRGLNKINEDPDDWILQYPPMILDDTDVFAHFKSKNDPAIDEIVFCPFGLPGDMIYAKETFYAYGYWVLEKKWRFVDCTEQFGNYRYFDNPPAEINTHRNDGIGWYKRPSLFMPFKAARFMRQIKEHRLERLQNISDKDAKAEGAPNTLTADNIKLLTGLGNWKIPRPFHEYQFGFLALWCKIHNCESWIANPWVWVVVWEDIKCKVNENY